MKLWKVTLRTGEHTWSTIELEANDYHLDAIEHARHLIGGTFVSVI